MATKKACILHTPQKKADAEAVAKRLQAEGYDTCVTGVSSQTAKSVQAGDMSTLPSTVAECLKDASICVILVDEEGCLGAVGGLASDAGCRVVTVGGSPDALPKELDDIADGHVPSPDTPDLIDIANGKDERITPDGSSAPPRKPKRVKCQ
jgi:hypothetical protein